MEAGVEFEAVDFPAANRLTIHILAAVAEHEARMISERTRVALSAAKARGIALGGFRGRAGTCKDLAHARRVRSQNAQRRALDLQSVLGEIGAGASLQTLAAGLNDRRIPAPRGGAWSANQVRRVLQRLSQARTSAYFS